MCTQFMSVATGPTTMQVFPVGDIMDHDLTEDCICGPLVEDDEDGTLIAHHSLDGREVLVPEEGVLDADPTV